MSTTYQATRPLENLRFKPIRPALSLKIKLLQLAESSKSGYIPKQNYKNRNILKRTELKTSRPTFP